MAKTQPCQEQGSAPEPYAWQSSMGYLYLWLRLSDEVLVWMDGVEFNAPLDTV